MNWQTKLSNALRTATEQAPAAPASDTGMIAMQLRDAAARYAKRPNQDDFTTRSLQACRDIADKLDQFGSFASDKQREYAEKLIKWSQPREPQNPTQQTTGVYSVPKLFAVMQKHSTFHITVGSIDVKISRKNQDSLCWIVVNDVVCGKIENSNVTYFGKRIFAAGWQQNSLADLLRELESNPLAAAMKYGKLAGRCCSCGRDLTDPESIEQGIGPVCREKF